jgi:hypothetical protein
MEAPMPREQTRVITAWLSGIVLAVLSAAFTLALAEELTR